MKDPLLASLFLASSWKRCSFGALTLTVGEKVAVNALELLSAQVARWTVLEETLVPGLDFLVGELGVLSEILQDFRFEFAVLFAHFGVGI